mmetsp:Transcript_16198/g.33512  ORF Transcript_16198/g.33512 Transcript_16198/m.33512 type:complete len:100 (-) Transcript_16198:82-381(-)
MAAMMMMMMPIHQSGSNLFTSPWTLEVAVNAEHEVRWMMGDTCEIHTLISITCNRHDKQLIFQFIQDIIHAQNLTVSVLTDSVQQKFERQMRERTESFS